MRLLLTPRSHALTRLATPSEAVRMAVALLLLLQRCQETQPCRPSLLLGRCCGHCRLLGHLVALLQPTSRREIQLCLTPPQAQSRASPCLCAPCVERGGGVATRLLNAMAGQLGASVETTSFGTAVGCARAGKGTWMVTAGISAASAGTGKYGWVSCDERGTAVVLSCLMFPASAGGQAL